MRMVGGTGIIGQDMVCGFGNGKYKTFEGTEISIENCVKARVKDLRVEGKTYQNLVSNLDELVGKVYALKNSANVISNLLKINTTYTFVIDISESNYSFRIGAIIVINYPTLNTDYIGISSRNGIFKIKYTVKEEIPKSISISPHANNDTTSFFKLDNLIILEGDYTNTDLPTSIDGIESVTERENNILSVKINDNVTTLNLPIPLRSLPNGVADTIEGDKLVQRVEKVVLDGSSDENWGTSSIIPQEETVIFQSTIIAETVKSNSYLISNKFNKISGWNDTETITIGGTGNVRLYIGINRNKLDTEDLKGFKKWLSENPVTVYYELAEPVIYSLEVPLIQTVKGTNIITTSNNIKPKLSMKVKVKK